MSKQPSDLHKYLNQQEGFSFLSHELVDWVDNDAQSTSPEEALRNGDDEKWGGKNHEGSWKQINKK